MRDLRFIGRNSVESQQQAKRSKSSVDGLGIDVTTPWVVDLFTAVRAHT
jgi:hypothetical protein